MSRLSRRKILATCLALGAIWIVSILLSLSVGSVSIRPGKALRLIQNLILGRASEDAAAEAILFSVRLPRILLGSLVGSALALAGASFQSLLRNPLADPYVLGVSTGASFGTILFSIGVSALGFSGFSGALSYAKPLAAFACAVGTVALVYLLSGGSDRAGETSQRLLLAGVVLASFISSLNVFLLTITNQADLRGIFYWLIGDLSRPVDAAIYPVTFIVCAGFILLYLFSYKLNLISMGEEDATLLGVNVPRSKLGVYIVASLVTGAVVSISGPIAYIGLICPHMGRLMVGSDNRILFPVVVLFGAIFTLSADTLARTILSPAELPVGVVTAFCGAPLFIYLLRRKGGGA